MRLQCVCSISAHCLWFRDLKGQTDKNDRQTREWQDKMKGGDVCCFTFQLHHQIPALPPPPFGNSYESFSHKSDCHNKIKTNQGEGMTQAKISCFSLRLRFCSSGHVSDLDGSILGKIKIVLQNYLIYLTPMIIIKLMVMIKHKICK